MKALYLLFFQLFHMLTICQNNSITTIDNEARIEVACSFIVDSIISNSKNRKYQFIAKIIDNAISTNKIVFSLSYIMNRDDIQLIRPTNYFEENNRIIFLEINDSYKNLKFAPISDSIIKLSLQSLPDPEKVYINYELTFYIISINKLNQVKYEEFNAYNLPKEYDMFYFQEQYINDIQTIEIKEDEILNQYKNDSTLKYDEDSIHKAIIEEIKKMKWKD